MTVTVRSAPPRATAPAGPAAAGAPRGGGRSRAPDPGPLVAAFEARCRVSSTLRSAMLLAPGGSGAPPRLLATWPPGAHPPESLARATARASRDGGTLVQPVDALRPDGPRLLAGRIAHRGRVVGVVAALLDGAPGEIDRDLARWRALVDVPAPGAGAVAGAAPGPAAAGAAPAPAVTPGAGGPHLPVRPDARGVGEPARTEGAVHPDGPARPGDAARARDAPRADGQPPATCAACPLAPRRAT